jgi:NAD(P)-dependent dehydrogenase (short-subunit alcohol dehydrogenase family)
LKVAVVTGASRGIGAGLVDGFLGVGYAVVATSRSIPPSDAHELLTIQGDIAEPETAHQVVEDAVARFGRVDTLVNNAGVYVGKPFIEYTAGDYEAVTRVNLAGFFHVTQRAIRQMVAQGGGHVVNITASLVDAPGAEPPSALAALTKGGVAAATRSLATEYASRGVRVNAVAPGPVGYAEEIGDIVEAVLYLERAAAVTGETVHVDGGQAASGGSTSS